MAITLDAFGNYTNDPGETKNKKTNKHTVVLEASTPTSLADAARSATANAIFLTSFLSGMALCSFDADMRSILPSSFPAMNVTAIYEASSKYAHQIRPVEMSTGPPTRIPSGECLSWSLRFNYVITLILTTSFLLMTLFNFKRLFTMALGSSPPVHSSAPYTWGIPSQTTLGGDGASPATGGVPPQQSFFSAECWGTGEHGAV